MMHPQFDPGFSTQAMTRLLSPAARVAAMCAFEAALARACADAGVAPPEVAERIAAACEAGIGDPDAVLTEGWEQGTPVLPLLSRLRNRLDEETAAWLHHGATTQDVVDTAMVLQARDGLAAIRTDLVALARDLRALAIEHRDRPTPGWTFLQPAVPTTTGRRAVGWLAPVVAHLRGLRQQAELLPVQLGGPSGTLDALGDAGIPVMERLASCLGLRAPDLPWHTDRTLVHALVDGLAATGRTMGRIGTDLALLAHHGVARMRAGSSSSMPGKSNPIDATRAVAAAEVGDAVAGVVARGRHELERGVGGWHAEWFAVPVVFHATAAAVEALGRAVATLEVIDPAPDAGAEGPTPASSAFVDRVVATCDTELDR